MDTSEIKRHNLPNKVVFTRDKKKLYGFKIKCVFPFVDKDVQDLFKSEVNRHGIYLRDEFNIAQMKYDGYSKY